MQFFLCLCVLFCVGSVGGWILELFFRRFVSSKKWINPGFLAGPYLPLYGFGVMGLFLISHYIRFDVWSSIPSWANDIITILIMGVAMTVIEYIAGIIFIKGMGIKLWDYSNRKWNIQGIICPLFSLFWTIIAALFHFLLTGPFEQLLEWFSNVSTTKAIIPFLLGMFYGTMLVDFGYSLKLATKIKEFAKEHQIVVRYEELKESIHEMQVKAKQKINFILPFKSETNLSEHLSEYLSKIKDGINNVVKKKK